MGPYRAVSRSSSVGASFDYTTSDALANFHRPYIRTSERIKFKLAVVVRGTAPQYLSDQLQYVHAALSTRRRGRGRLYSFTCRHTRLPPSRYDTVGDRSFPTAGHGPLDTGTQGSLSRPTTLEHAQSATSITAFRQKLKTHLFRQSYPLFCSCVVAIVVLEFTLLKPLQIVSILILILIYITNRF